jgi:AcrR family transcriptional regulator
MTAEVSTRRQQTRDRLMVAATELFAEKSVQAAAVEEICERAGFTRGAFYSNFDSKDDLCLELVRLRGEQLLATTKSALASIPDAAVTEHTLSEVIAKVLAVFDAGFSLDDNWVLVRNELRLYAHRNPKFRPAMIETEHRATALAIEAILAAMTRQRAQLLIPIDQLMVILDSYCERTRMDDILAGRPDDGHTWRNGLEHVLRALVVLPKPAEAD